MLDLHLPGTPSLVFLAFVLGLLPWMALRSAARVRAVRAAGTEATLPSRTQLWGNTILLQAVIGLLAWRVGSGFGYPLFGWEDPSWVDAVWTALALLACLGLRQLVRAWRTPEERRTLFVFVLAPRTARERALRTVAILLAGVAEELAYRGVVVAILTYSLGSVPLAIALSVAAFTAVHALQGAKSAVIVASVALVMHALVWATGTLLCAMAVHIVYDFLAARAIEAELAAREAAGSPPPTG
ncbi:MAG: CPBP family intramembrane metalloprotease [Alphaproteobacteria bacterium]|nr:CPBP family intramembrane metalloprotease [Alphaproteobacteria bacterium]